MKSFYKTAESAKNERDYDYVRILRNPHQYTDEQVAKAVLSQLIKQNISTYPTRHLAQLRSLKDNYGKNLYGKFMLGGGVLGALLGTGIAGTRGLIGKLFYGTPMPPLGGYLGSSLKGALIGVALGALYPPVYRKLMEKHRERMEAEYLNNVSRFAYSLIQNDPRTEFVGITPGKPEPDQGREAVFRVYYELDPTVKLYNQYREGISKALNYPLPELRLVDELNMRDEVRKYLEQ